MKTVFHRLFYSLLRSAGGLVSRSLLRSERGFLAIANSPLVPLDVLTEAPEKPVPAGARCTNKAELKRLIAWFEQIPDNHIDMHTCYSSAPRHESGIYSLEPNCVLGHLSYSSKFDVRKPNVVTALNNTALSYVCALYYTADMRKAIMYSQPVGAPAKVECLRRMNALLKAA